MRTKLISIIVVISILLSVFFVNWNFILAAESLNNEVDSTSTSRSNEHPRAGGFDWSEIEVISEPIFGHNNNLNYSTDPCIAIEEDKIYTVWGCGTLVETGLVVAQLTGVRFPPSTQQNHRYENN